MERRYNRGSSPGLYVLQQDVMRSRPPATPRYDAQLGQTFPPTQPYRELAPRISAQVIRTRMFVTDVSQWQQVAKVHGAVFADVRPTTSIVQIANLIDADARIGIGADAVVA